MWLFKVLKMGDPNQQIIVVEKNILFEGNYFQGFRQHHEFDYEKRILDNIKIMRRGSTNEPLDHPHGNAELDDTHKQPIGYMIIVNPYTKSVFAFERSKESDSRLKGKWSWGVGGHIEPFDMNHTTNNPLTESRLRELKEEVVIEGNIKNIYPLGYINDDNDEVGKVHFGILYLIEIDGSARAGCEEMKKAEMVSVSTLESLCKSDGVIVESWSEIALSPLKVYMNSI